MRIEINGLNEVLKTLKGLEDVKSQAAVLAVNSTVRFGYSEASRGIRHDINVSAGYIGTPNAGNRLEVTQFARPGKPEAVLFAKGRATSLARYMTSGTVGKAGVRVSVGRGKGTKGLPKAFPVRLKKGATLTEDQFNQGIALRLKKGAKVRNKYRMKEYDKREDENAKSRLYLLIAPSVSQVFEQVAGDIEPKVSSFLQREFLRQFGRLNRG